jgi:hypothetical protein
VTAIHIFAPTDKLQVIFRSDLSNLFDTFTSNTLIKLRGGPGYFRGYIQTFTAPVPMSGVRIFCDNLEENCRLNMALIGTSQ